MTITTDYKKNKALLADFNHVVARAVRRRRTMGMRIFCGIFGVLGLVAGGLLLWIGEDIPIAILGLVAGAFFAFRAVFYYQYIGFLAGRLLTKRVDQVVYTFDDEGVSVDNALEHCEHPYHVFEGVYESRRLFVLLVTNRVGYLIAKSDLKGEEIEALRALLQTRFEVPLTTYDF